MRHSDGNSHVLGTYADIVRQHRVGATAIATVVLLFAGLVALPTIDDEEVGTNEVRARNQASAPRPSEAETSAPERDLAESGRESPARPDDGPADEAPSGPESTPGGGEDVDPAPDDGPPDDEPRDDPPGDDRTARGVTRDEIRIGFWLVNSDAGCGAIGLTGEGTSCTNEDQNQIKALAEHVNGQGGVAGRDLVPVFHESDAANGTFAAQAQAACTAFTEDHEVFAVVSEGVVGRPFMATCLADRGVPVIDPGFWPFDDDLYDDLEPFLYQPSRPRPERWVGAYIDGLADQGFFDDPGVSVGLLRFDSAPFDRVTERVLKPRLADHGMDLTDEIEIETPDSVAAFGSMNSELSNAVVRLRANGVNRVIFFATHGEMAVFYFQQAESQGYRPTYGLSSMESMRLQSEQGPANQFEDAVGVGWLPQFDVFTDDDPGGSATADLCKRILQDAGLQGGAGRHTHCDNVFFLSTVLDRTPSFDAAGFRSTVERLGDDWEPAATFAAEFGPGRYDGPAGLRYTAWDDGCGCFRYQGGTRPLP